jgi:serine/threonine protein kinase/tetratricopeptide (TPR) repeat protein
MGNGMNEPLRNPATAKREIFLEALEYDSPEQRIAFLDRACANNDAIRAAVEKLLKHHKNDDFMQAPGLQAAPLSALEKPGDRIGCYKILQQIGEGGCGIVYMAEQEKPVRRKVALKVIKPGMGTRSIIARFEAERQALALMDHPNIAKVLEAGATETGRPYFVMELVRGIKITDFCDQNKLPIQGRLQLFIQVCQAIQHAHQKGIIHRDIKPSNILVTLRDGVAMPNVIDFGIAKATQERLTDKTLFTAFQQFIGTPAYMSPEQAEMSELGIDTRSDIYSLGVLLYELLVGRTPFDSTTLMQSGLDEIRRVIREEEPARPSNCLRTMRGSDLAAIASCRQLEPTGLIDLVKRDLDWIVMKALEKDRTRRYETASELAADIERHLQDKPVEARPPSNLYKIHKWVRRNKLAFAGASVIAVVLVAATGISAWQAALARQRQVESESISKFLTEVFQSPDPFRDARTITVAEALAAAAKKLETDLAGQPARRAKLESTLVETYHRLGLHREALPLQEKVFDYYHATFGPENPATLDAMRWLAREYQATARLNDALSLREQLLALRLKVNGPEDTNTLWAMNDLAISYADAGRHREALKLREQVLAMRRKVSGPGSPDTLAAMRSLGTSYDDADLTEQALKLHEEMAAICGKIKGPEDPVTLGVLQEVAFSYYQVGRLDEAIQLGEKLASTEARIRGPEHPDTLAAINNLAVFYGADGRRDEALKLREDVLRLRKKAFGPEYSDTIWAMHELATSYDEFGRREEALKLREQVLAMRQKINAPDHPGVITAMADLATSYDEAGFRDQALQMRERVVELLRHEYGPGYSQTIEAMSRLAISYEEAGRYDEATALREQVLVRRRQILVTNHPKTLESMNALANAYGSAGRSQEAISLLERAWESNPKEGTLGLNLAAWQAWLGRDGDYETTRRHLLEIAKTTGQASIKDGAVKAFCLRPSTNAAFLAESLDLAQMAVRLAGTNSWLPYYRVGLALAEYRNGQFAQCGKDLTAAEASIFYLPETLGTARLFRAMSLFRQNKPVEARALFRQVEAEMVPLPADERKPRAAGKQVDEDVLIWWLAYKEARTLIAPVSEPAQK